MNRYRITTSGQVSIPAAVRRRWKTRSVQVEDQGDHVVVRPLPDDPVEAAYGALQGKLRMPSDEARQLVREENDRIEKRKLRLYGLR